MLNNQWIERTGLLVIRTEDYNFSYSWLSEFKLIKDKRESGREGYLIKIITPWDAAVIVRWFFIIPSRFHHHCVCNSRSEAEKGWIHFWISTWTANVERLLHNIANDGQFFPWLASVNKPVEIFTPLFSIGFCQYKWLIMQTMHHWPLW